MPAGSEAAGDATSRIVFRPRRARRVVYLAVALLVAAFLGGSLTLPWSGEGGWGIGSRVALGLVTLAIAYFLHRLASVRVVADASGAEVVNIVGRRRLEWAEIVGVRLSPDDAWLVLDLSDGETMFAMGVQKSEGKLGQRQAQEFARLVNERTPKIDN